MKTKITMIRLVLDKLRMCSIGCFISCFFCISNMSAQGDAPYDPKTVNSEKPGDCCKAPSFRKVKLPAPPLMPGVGVSHLQITTRSDSAQRYFDQGLSLIHDFWEFEAFRAFEQVAQLDSNAVMAYWGMYFSINRYLQHRKIDRADLIKKVKKFRKHASKHEELYLQAILVEDSLSAYPERATRAFQLEMEHLIHKFPEDAEAKLLLWYKMEQGYDPSSKPKENAVYAEQLLRNLLRSHPDHHGVHHYWVHQRENCCPAEALESADKLGSLAPNSGHIVHMPGHIYYRLGQFKKARAAFLASSRTDSIYLAKTKIDKIDNWNYIHNYNFLIANSAAEGRYKESIHLTEKLLNDFTLVQDTSYLDEKSEYYPFFFNMDWFQPIELELRFGYWDKAIRRLNLLSDLQLSLSGTPENINAIKARKEILLAFAKGQNAVERKQTKLAEQLCYELDAKLYRLVKQEKNSYPRITDAFHDALSYELRGNTASLQGDTAKAFEYLKLAIKAEKNIGYREPPIYFRPVRLSLIQAYIKAKQWQKAEEVVKQLLVLFPNNGPALFYRAEILWYEGKTGAAKKAYSEFLSQWDQADAELQEIKIAHARLKTL